MGYGDDAYDSAASGNYYLLVFRAHRPLWGDFSVDGSCVWGVEPELLIARAAKPLLYIIPMTLERGSAVIGPEAEMPHSLAILDTLRLQASEDEELAEKYEEVINLIDNYALAKMRHTQYAERNQSRIQLDERYAQRFNEMNQDRNEAHNKLIAALNEFSSRALTIGLDSSWLDGPQGIAQERRGRTSRQSIDDWAMDIWLDQQENRDHH